MKPQQEMSSYPSVEEDLPEIKTISKEENEESKVTVNQIVEVTDEVPLIFSLKQRGLPWAKQFTKRQEVNAKRQNSHCRSNLKQANHGKSRVWSRKMETLWKSLHIREHSLIRKI